MRPLNSVDTPRSGDIGDVRGCTEYVVQSVKSGGCRRMDRDRHAKRSKSFRGISEHRSATIAPVIDYLNLVTWKQDWQSSKSEIDVTLRMHVSIGRVENRRSSHMKSKQ
jgi:hypothetical protein